MVTYVFLGNNSVHIILFDLSGGKKRCTRHEVDRWKKNIRGSEHRAKPVLWDGNYDRKNNDYTNALGLVHTLT